MAQYLDPKYDLTFKRVFGEHKHLCISLINNMLFFDEDRKVVSIEYETNELLPEQKSMRNSIVDVRCKDNYGRNFIVEMQMNWTESFKQRVLFNASKVYIKNLNEAEEYEKLTPVYSLNFVNHTFEKSPEMADVYYHHYKIVNVECPERQIEGLEFVFIELKKFKPQNRAEKLLHELWLRFLTEVNEKTEAIPAELLEQAEIREAIRYMEIGAFSKAELAAYDKDRDVIMRERMYYGDAEKIGIAKGLAKGERIGLAKGEKIGIAKGKKIGIAKGLAEGEKKGIAKGEHERKKLQQELSDKDKEIARLQELLNNK